jgi:hypothetical protein
MWRLDVSSEAEVEIFEAALRYERERIGLGVRFETQVNTVFARLVDNPFQFPVIEEGVRRAIVRVFPYAVYSHWKPISLRCSPYFTCIDTRTPGSESARTASKRRASCQNGWSLQNLRAPLKIAHRSERGFEVDFGVKHATKDTRKSRWNVGEIACRI